MLLTEERFRLFDWEMKQVLRFQIMQEESGRYREQV